MEKNKAIAKRWPDEVWSKGKMAAIDELSVFNYPPPGIETNMEAYKQVIAMYSTGQLEKKKT